MTSTKRKGTSLKNYKFLKIKDIYPKPQMHARAEIKVHGHTYDSVVQHAVNMKRCNFITFSLPCAGFNPASFRSTELM